MSELNITHTRAVWIDIPVKDLDRAKDFYAKTLNIEVLIEQFGDIRFGVLEHDEGNGGCLVIQPENVGHQGPLVYLNANSRIQEATKQAEENGGKILEPIHSIGPHGFRSIIEDSEGNRVALHSETDS